MWVRFEWKPCAPGAEALGFVSCISNPFWERDQFEFTDGLHVLESVTPTGKPVFIPGTGRGHVCGTEQDFSEGGLFDESIPGIQLGRAGLPACCNPPVVGLGGVVDGGKVLSGIVPGNSCLTATVGQVGVPLLLVIPAAQAVWLKFPAPAGPTWHITFASSANPSVGLASGADCFNLFNEGVTDFGVTPCEQYGFSPIAGNLWLSWNATGAWSGTVTVAEGPC